MRSILAMLVFVTVSVVPALAQSIPLAGVLRQAKATFIPVNRAVDLSGPRFGLTMLPKELRDKLRDERDIVLGESISQFGWQFERQLYTGESGFTLMSEWVALVGGLDQSQPIPSLNWLVGFRTREGAEFGIGPNITPAGTALAIAAGVTFRAGAINVPMNFAYVPSRYGARFSVLTGFNMRRR